jgi:uncharacterized protein YraI
MTSTSKIAKSAAAVFGAGVLALIASAPQALAWPAEATRELAVREGPGQQYPHIEVIPPGTVVDIRHCNVDRTWCKVDTNGAIGYLRGTYLQRIGDVYYGPRLDLYPAYRTRVYVAPVRPYYRDYGPGYYGHRRY